jgi:hypothetical protein
LAESATHIDLINSILLHAGLFAKSEILIFTDRPGESGDRKSYRINGFVPDVYAAELRGPAKIIGEAKTAKDFFSPHTALQLVAFMDFLRFQPSAALILAVPYALLPAGKSLLRRIAVQVAAEHIRMACCCGCVLVDASISAETPSK